MRGTLATILLSALLLPLGSLLAVPAAAGSPADASATEAKVRFLEEETQSIAESRPDLFPDPPQPIPEDRIAATPVLALREAAILLARHRIHAELGMAMNASTFPVSGPAWADWITRFNARVQEAADAAFAEARAAGLPASGVALEDAVHHLLPAVSTHTLRPLLDRTTQQAQHGNPPPTTEQIYVVLETGEANRILLQEAPPLEEPERPLQMEDALAVRARISYNPDTTDINVQAAELLAADALEDGDAVGILLYTVQAETGYWSITSQRVGYQEDGNLAPDVEEELAWAAGQPGSLLLEHAAELGRLMVESLPEGGAAGPNNAGVVAAETLARFSAVHLLRGEGTPALKTTSEEAQGPGFPWAPLAVSLVAAAAARRRQPARLQEP